MRRPTDQALSCRPPREATRLTRQTPGGSTPTRAAGGWQAAGSEAAAGQLQYLVRQRVSGGGGKSIKASWLYSNSGEKGAIQVRIRRRPMRVRVLIELAATGLFCWLTAAAAEPRDANPDVVDVEDALTEPADADDEADIRADDDPDDVGQGALQPSETTPPADSQGAGAEPNRD
jgi:hypothetical protein